MRPRASMRNPLQPIESDSAEMPGPFAEMPVKQYREDRVITMTELATHKDSTTASNLPGSIAAEHSWREALTALATGAEKQPRTMPPEFYYSSELVEQEQRSVFVTGWIPVGRVDEVPESGDYFTLDIVGEPLLVVRGKDQRLKVLSNVCRHRGSLIMQGSGNVKKLSCPYHQWTYALDGKLLVAPLVEESDHFKRNECSLPEIRSAEWMGFLFVNLNAQAAPFADSISGLDPYVANYHVEEMRTVHAGPETWPVNWKCLAENFMEGYHLTPVHLNTLHPMTPTRLCEKIPGGAGYTGYKSHYSETFPGRKPFHEDMTEEERNQSMMVWIYPSFVAAFSPNSTVFMSVTPTGPTELQTRWGVAARPELFDDGEADARYEFAQSFNAEDKARLIDVQRGLQSRFAARGPLAPADYEGTVWDFYQYMASRLLANDNLRSK